MAKQEIKDLNLRSVHVDHLRFLVQMLVKEAFMIPRKGLVEESNPGQEQSVHLPNDGNNERNEI